MQRERRDEDQVQAPLYIEATPSQSAEDDQKDIEDQISTFYMEDDEEEEKCEGEYTKLDVSFDQEEMDDYCKKFTDFMQAELHKKYDLRSKNRLRTQDDEEKEPDLVPSPMATPNKEFSKTIRQGETTYEFSESK